MHKFTCAADIGDLRTAVAEALEIKRDRYQFTGLGRNKTLLMLFFNSSLRTRLSTQKAAMNLGMNVMVLDVNQGAWTATRPNTCSKPFPSWGPIAT